MAGKVIEVLQGGCRCRPPHPSFLRLSFWRRRWRIYHLRLYQLYVQLLAIMALYIKPHEDMKLDSKRHVVVLRPAVRGR
jgi:hypothetical protein